MKASVKVKGILAIAGVTYNELATLCGLSRQSIHNYLSDKTYLEDTEGGLKVIDTTAVLSQLAAKGTLPLSRSLTKEEKLANLKSLLDASATVS